jgi:hypothetical protein
MREKALLWAAALALKYAEKWAAKKKAEKTAAVPVEVQKPPAPQGLQLMRFTQGETLPWKGIMFRLAVIEPNRLIIEPVGMTAARAKAMKEKHGR